VPWVCHLVRLLVFHWRAPLLVWRQVVRGGRVQTVSIFTLVVGDVVPLAIGDQVLPACHTVPLTFLQYNAQSRVQHT